ncbi:murein L,D-transpeptidase catalytic domain-containing protein [Bdellovibrio sp. HCB185ZH]|uniref:murein L,D-transpeptidase catalytic domain-containing protein n=1 Tax=Bdellovibrio sp. HCB185ZH TaxID=3394235 RepID=UPI0039A6AC1B
MSKKVISILLLWSCGAPAVAFAGFFSKKDERWNTYVARVEEVASRERAIPRVAIERTVQFLESNRARLENRINNRSVVIINDFTEESTRDRMFVIYVNLGKVERYKVAHGIGSGEGPHVYKCSNTEGSKATPPGFMLVQNENRNSSFGSALYMDSLESRNSNSRERAVVFHPNKSAAERARILREYGFIDLSEGCTQLTKEDYYKLKPRVQGGSLLYNFCPEDKD